MHLFEIFEKYFDSFFRSTRSNRFKVSEHRNYWKRFNQIYQHASFRTRRETLLPTVASIESIIIETKLCSVVKAWTARREQSMQCDIVIMNGKLSHFLRLGLGLHSQLLTAIYHGIPEQSFRLCVACFYLYTKISFKPCIYLANWRCFGVQSAALRLLMQWMPQTKGINHW